MGARPRGPATRRQWSADVAYVVGLLVTDGYLSTDGRHLALVSADVQALEAVRRILGLGNRITVHTSGRGIVSRLQFGDRLFVDWLISIGFTPRKTYTVGALAVPDGVFADFVRGHLDGDGSVIAYIDRHLQTRKASYVYRRLYVRFLSASRPHVDWLRTRVAALLGIRGCVTTQRHPLSTVPLYALQFAKREAITLLRWIYYAPNLPCLSRKRAIAEPFLVGDLRDFRHP
jgi:hypothetical protein